MRKITFFFLLLFTIVFVFGQNRTMDSLNLVLKNAKNDTTRLNIYEELCYACTTEENPKYGNSGLKLTNKLLFSTNDLKQRKRLLKHKISFIKTISVYYDDKNDYSNLIKNNQLLYPIYKELNDTGKIEETFVEISNLLLKSGNTTAAFDSLMLKLKYYEKKNINRFIAFYQLQIAESYNQVNSAEKSLEYYLKSLNTYTILKRKNKIAPIYLKMAEQYSMLGQPKKSLECAFNVLKINEKTNSPEENHWIYWRISGNYNTLKEYNLAFKYDSLCLEAAKKTNEIILISNAYANFANTFEDAGKYKEAEFYQYKSLETIKKTDNNFAIMLALDRISRLNLDLNKYDLSIKYALEASIIAKNRQDVNMLMRTSSLLFRSFQLKGNSKLALKYHINYILYRDSLQNIESHAELNQRETKNAFEKEEEKIKLEQEKKDVETTANKKNQQLITFGVTGILLIVIIFSSLLYKRFRLSNKQKTIIEQQKHLVEEKHKEIKDSINYAERIQRSFLASDELLNNNLKNYFILFKPKDVVSGDFYWGETLPNGNFILATADSTGHGVPGAIMSLLNITSLEKAIEHLTNPADILKHTRQTIINRLKKDGSEYGGKDGMDCSLIVFDFKNMQIQIAAANNPVWIFRNTNLIEIKPDKIPVGKHDRDQEEFTLNTFDILEGDIIYTLTDGFPDQFGGPKGKKYMSKNLKELLVANANLPMKEQKSILDKSFTNWVGNFEQVDDVTIIGVKI